MKPAFPDLAPSKSLYPLQSRTVLVPSTAPAESLVAPAASSDNLRVNHHSFVNFHDGGASAGGLYFKREQCPPTANATIVEESFEGTDSEIEQGFIKEYQSIVNSIPMDSLKLDFPIEGLGPISEVLATSISGFTVFHPYGNIVCW